MDSKIRKNLEQAKAQFYSLHLIEAYNIFRRYFDRLPFQPEPEHAEYIGMFARILAELGKEYDLNFYLGELERLHDKLRDPAIAYQLAVVYAYLSEPRLETSRKLLDKIIRDPKAKELHAKAKMMLADYYDRIQHDLAACRKLIESIGEVSDPSLSILVDIWKAKISRDENNFAESEKIILGVLSRVTPAQNWYAYFSARVVQALLFIKRGTPLEARQIIDEIRELFQGRHFKSVMIQIESLEKLIQQDQALSTLKLLCDETNTVLCYENKSLSLNGKSPSDRLLVLLAKRGYLDKAFIVKSLYSRTYDSERDDKLIYYHVHSLRKR
jgi:hypothetical protein